MRKHVLTTLCLSLSVSVSMSRACGSMRTCMGACGSHVKERAAAYASAREHTEVYMSSHSYAPASTQSQIEHFLPHLSGRGQMLTYKHPKPDRTPPTAPLWETTVAHLPSTQSQIEHPIPHLSGRRPLHTCEHPGTDRIPPTAPLWERTVAHLRAPRVKSRSFYHASLGEDCCVLASTQSQIKKLLPRLPGRRLLRTCEHPEPHQEPPTTHLWETTLAHLRAPRARSRTSYRILLEDDNCTLRAPRAKSSTS